MAAVAVQRIIRYLRKVSLGQDERGLADGALLECFLTSRDESAFTTLVQRYGPMVLGVCRRVLRNRHDAEDAFQATFVVLVRKGNTIVPREMVGNWLYGVAYRTALEARRTVAKRREKERTMPRAEAQTEVTGDDLQALIDQELHALPAKYRDPIILCDLQGKTRQEAARKLGCPEGTIAGRLARGREMLAKRLTKHGIVISAAGLALFFSQNITSAAVPMTLVSATVNTALTGAISSPVAALTEGVMKAMLLTKLKIAAAAVLIVSLIAVGGTFLTGQMLAAQRNQSGNVADGGLDNAVAQGKGKGKGKDKPPAPTEKLQGIWALTELMDKGTKATDAKTQSLTIEFKNEAIILTFKDEAPIKGTFTVDPKNSPATMDICFEKGGKQVTIPFIYELKGDDLKLCNRYEGGDRPTAIEASPTTILMTLRKKNSKVEPKDRGADTDKQEKEGFTAWGKEVGGLQAGLGFHPGEKRAYSHGETVRLVVRVRNVGKEAVKFQYLRQFFIETPPTVTDGKGKPVPPVGIDALGFHIPVEVSLAPGKEIELNELKLGLKPASESGSISFETLYGTGKFQIQYERVFGNSSAGSIKLNPALSKLATGNLELEVRDAQKDKDADKPAKKDLDKLTGTWEKDSWEWKGQPQQVRASSQYVFKGDKFAEILEGKEINKGKIKLDPAKNTIDLSITAGQDKGSTLLGLYVLDGDSFKICFRPGGTVRPKEFKTTADSDAKIWTYKRKKAPDGIDGKAKDAEKGKDAEKPGATGDASNGGTAAQPAAKEGRIYFWLDQRLASVQPDGKDFKWHSKVMVNSSGFPNVAYLGDLRISPDGRRVAFNMGAWRSGDDAKTDTAVKMRVLSLDKAEPIIDLGGYANDKVWSPDGAKLACSFVEYDETEDRFHRSNWMIDVKTKKKTELNLPAGHLVMDWS